MDSSDYYTSLVAVLYLIALPIFLSLHFIQAPYGRHRRSGWGPTLSPAITWFLMESPTVYFYLIVYFFGSHFSSPRSLVLSSVVLLHYIHRTCIYPLRLRSSNKTKANDNGFPISVAMMGFTFNLLNSYVQARWVSHYGKYEDDVWFWWRFSGGMVIFLAGMATNVWADKVLVGLKAAKDGGSGGGYKVPRGGLFELVSCPNYFGEIVEWLGWAIMTWSAPGFGFFLNTCANLMPRARANHAWYLEKFREDYPKNRKAVIPFLY